MANSSLVGILAETTASYVATNLLIVLFQMTVYALEFLYSKVGSCHSYTTVFNNSSSTKIKVASPDALAWNSFYYFNTFQLPQIATPPDSPDSTWSLSIFGTLFVHSPIFFIVATLLMIIFALITIIGVTTDVFSKSKYLPHLPVPNVSPRLRRSSVSTSDHDHHDTPVLALPLPFLTLIARVFRTFVIWISLILAVIATVSWMFGGLNMIVWIDGVLGDMQDSCSRLLTSGAIGSHTLHDLLSFARNFPLVAQRAYDHCRSAVLTKLSYPLSTRRLESPYILSPSSPFFPRPLYSPMEFSGMSVRTLALGFLLEIILSLCMVGIMFLRGYRLRIDDRQLLVGTVIVDDLAHEPVKDEVVKLEPEATPVISTTIAPEEPLLTAPEPEAGPQDTIPPVILPQTIPPESSTQNYTMKRGYCLNEPASYGEVCAWKYLEEAHDDFLREKARAEAGWRARQAFRDARAWLRRKEAAEAKTKQRRSSI